MFTAFTASASAEQPSELLRTARVQTIFELLPLGTHSAADLVPRKRVIPRTESEGFLKGTPAAGLECLEEDVLTRDGEGFALRHGYVYRWDNVCACWSRLRCGEISQMKLGADGHAYVVNRLGAVWRIEEIAGEGTRITPHTHHTAKVLDLAASPIGSMAFLLEDGKTGSRTLRWEPAGGLDATLPAPIRLISGRLCANPADGPTIKPSIETARVVSLATGHDGLLYVLDADGEIWRANVENLQDDGATAWRRIDVLAHGKIVRLTTLGNGSIGAFLAPRDSPDAGLTRVERRTTLDADGVWRDTTSIRRTITATYGQFPEHSRWNSLPLGTLFPGFKTLRARADDAVGTSGSAARATKAVRSALEGRLAPLRSTQPLRAPGMPCRPGQEASRTARWPCGESASGRLPACSRPEDTPPASSV